jgi:hypothetical protein
MPMKGEEMDLHEVAYCGLYCGLCACRRRIPEEATRLRETLRAEGYDQGFFDIPELAPKFPALWEGLNLLADRPCAGCRRGGGYGLCPIRACARERGVETCSACDDFPCERFSMLERYPTCLPDNRRMQKVGLSAWIAEQEARAAHGFSYQDVRLPEPPAPDKDG